MTYIRLPSIIDFSQVFNCSLSLFVNLPKKLQKMENQPKQSCAKRNKFCKICGHYIFVAKSLLSISATIEKAFEEYFGHPMTVTNFAPERACANCVRSLRGN